ncbi:MAG: helix-turn-helix domain-containing protein [Hydrogenophaga sp.]|uniref:helix-turn-helix domain-containing protein n=1 Tax=Hydrogenophaga sp. TaxID=1904254 RepID=UPI00169C1BD1|nr:AraC family transcriptional regulator [Hydrogenophaga sp.]NIM43210.1 helix-turn-helix domain-containing protein [Hydrogenophaga sp.]NIN28278.1 helix-turn-helix domain-containing protein [Hydrogenophaga sp.]NIN29097.1 helix-turn-helix domain-containing protein [Hydrogenophaga sp.]NIN57413.1 helix-turn-helix domain-containing protein [Hydrogenophaga sp.]NIO53708.1 helix-turn-helix domain-containing protein [Hydrogenophaga sp.]
MPERLFIRLPEDPSCAPETTVPANTLTAFAVPARLRSAVAHVMAYEERFAPGHEAVERVLPDGASRLLIALHRDSATVHVAGARADAVLLAMGGHVHGLSVTLKPGALPALFGVPAKELAGLTVPWEDLVPSAHRHLGEQLAASDDDAARVQHLLASLQALQRPADPSRHLVEHAARRLSDTMGGLSVRELAAELHIGERRVQQLFAANIGLAPGVWRRLQRLHGTLRLLRTTRTAETPRWAEMALDAGYCDQSHLINEFRSFCGLTPQQLLQRAVSGSSNTGAGRFT